MAFKYFGIEDPIGKALIFDDRDTLNVSGVFQDIPENTHFTADFLISRSTFRYDENGNWSNIDCYTYVLLNEKASVEALQAKNANSNK